MTAQGIHRIPLFLPPSLEPQREYLEKTLINAQQRLKSFAGANGWREYITESFADQAQIFDKKENFDNVLKLISGTEPAIELPKTFCAALENRVLLCVSPELYRKNYPEGDEEKAYEKLITHEMAHRLHVRILKGDDDAMGPVWFFEGFAIHAADQFANACLGPDEIWRIIQSTERGSYKKYGAVIRYLLEKISIHDLVAHACDENFTEWLWTNRLGDRNGVKSITNRKS